jgi:hypothetical protein
MISVHMKNKAPRGARATRPAGLLFFVGFACATWFGIVSFLGGYLIKKEIASRLSDRP